MSDTETGVVVGVQRTISAYARLVDGRDMAGCARLFTDDARITVMGEVHDGRVAICTWLDGLAKSAPGIHLTTNTLVDSSGGDDARATSDVAFIKRDETGWKILVAGQYVDTLRRGSGGWQFTSRTISLS
jgi:ketosteroid isomerase-like protein